MLQVGKFNRLKVCKLVNFGVFLDGGSAGNILLPKRYLPDTVTIGDELDVFIYYDSEDQLIATTQTPKAQLGECAYLKVTDINDNGAFLDWGLAKDLMVPYNEQHKPMEIGKSYVVYIYQDIHSRRLVASSRLNRHLSEFSIYFKPLQEVDLLICGKSDMGYKAIINHTHLGLIFRDDAFKPLRYGAQIKGYIKSIRRDNKIDLSLQLPPEKQREELPERIIAHLKDNAGVSSLTDKSAPDNIYHQYGVSKSNYKKALGQLYKQKKIVLGKDEIRLMDK